ncbi:MAG: type III polyketide synthase [Bacteroidota bacterium]|jgi:predicted naringenin-chalcone synthase
MSYIVAIETAVPQYMHRQEDVTQFYQNATDDEVIKRKIKVIGLKSGIEKRYSVIPDFSVDKNQYEFFPKTDNLEPAPTLSARMQVFRKFALQLSLKAVLKIKDFENLKPEITHIITVSCTGMYAPGLEIELIKALELKKETQRSSFNFMGCNAAILALRAADAICNSTKDTKVLIVCVELCTIHFQNNFTDDYLLSTALFADGAAAVIVSAEKPKAPYYDGLKIDRFDSVVIHEGENEMAWQLSETGFIMNLTSYVSELVNINMKVLLEAMKLDFTTIKKWAIHPGGRKILDDFVEKMQVEKQQLFESYDTLKNYGNMSSATILFVLKQILETSKQTNEDENIFCAAFGPGLSIETMQLKYV